MPNLLKNEKSPYLLQHADNPVDWRPWGEEAFAEAARLDRPVFLSIGYATCHWCHVMAHESFENPGAAALLNENFIAIKVDREERPDVDQVYMAACQALTGRGGWPLSVFLTPDKRPFFAGTYFPLTDRPGLPGFITLINHFAQAWKSDRPRLLEAAQGITSAIGQLTLNPSGGPGLSADLIASGLAAHEEAFDPAEGGFGPAPKFPAPHHLVFLINQAARGAKKKAWEMARLTLDRMRAGGVCDQVGGGFHRYSVDARWFAPHFEKMLYDQALIASAYLAAWEYSGQARFARTARQTLDYALRDLRGGHGGFFCGEDADSQGREGAFYLWREEEIDTLLGSGARLFKKAFDVRPQGNFEDGLNILARTDLTSLARDEGLEPDALEERLEAALGLLFAARKKRKRPSLDDKVLTSWNGLMIAALARAGALLDEPAYIQAAGRALDFIEKNLTTPAGRLVRRWRDGQAAGQAFLDDYVFLTQGLTELFLATFEPAYLERALTLARLTQELFADPEGGGFFFSGQENETLPAPSKDIWDSALPSANSAAAMNLLVLGRLSGQAWLEDAALNLLEGFSAQMLSAPLGATGYLTALDLALGESREIVITGPAAHPETRAMLSQARRNRRPGDVLIHLDPENAGAARLMELAPHLAAFGAAASQPRAYVCVNFACQTPLEDAASLGARLAKREKTP